MESVVYRSVVGVIKWESVLHDPYTKSSKWNQLFVIGVIEWV